MPVATYTPVRAILIVLAIICFVLGMFSVALPVNIVDLGLAFFAGAFLVPVAAAVT
jgi:hypothetical protein